MLDELNQAVNIRKPVETEELFSAFEKLNVPLVSKEIREVVV